MDVNDPTTPVWFLPRARSESVLDALRAQGYRCVGPQARDGAIVYDTLEQWSQLPHGYTEQQAPGVYRLEIRDHHRAFGWANGPAALKPLLFAPRETVWRAEKDEAGALVFRAVMPAPVPLAVIGVRACDVAALRIHDRVFLGQSAHDPYYAARRAALLLIGVNCSHPADTCFCASTGDGPVIEAGCDVVLTELDDGYLVRADSDAGRTLVAALSLDAATDAHHFAAGQQRVAATRAQHRTLPPVERRQQLMQRLTHPRWDEVAERCLSCGNCTAVCPTCFCHSQHDEPALDGTHSEHVREWDSCFTQKHSYIHGLTVRAETRTRYRQWLTHKLATWHEQFDTSGCVGCGRCITWCPVGIDLTEEVGVIVGEDAA